MLTAINEINKFNLDKIDKLLEELEYRDDSNCNIKLIEHLENDNERTKFETLTKNSNVNFLINDEWNYSEIAKYKCPKHWKGLFETSIDLLNDIDYIMEMNKIKNNIVVPYKKDTFKPFHLCKPEDIKVIIFSSKPYSTICPINNIPLATGVPFSIPDNSIQTKPLKNILECFKKSEYYNNERLDNIFKLDPWYSEGVFLLDTCLTSEIKSSNSHGVIWHGFISKFINFVESKSGRDIIYVFLGKQSVDVDCFIKSTSILKYPHPFMYYFKDSNMFDEINDLLEELDEDKINWNVIF